MTNSTTKAFAVAAAADNENIGLFPQPNTPLETLTKGTFTSQFDFSYLEGKSLQEQLDGLENNYGVVSGSDQVADAEYDAFVKQISGFVTGQIDYAKNTILPVLKDYVKIVTERMVLPVTIMSNFDVVVKDIPEPMRNPGFRQRIQDRGNGLYANPEVHLLLPKPEGNIIDKLMTGSLDYDADIRQWATGLGEDKISEMWDNLYTDRGTPGRLVDYLERGTSGLDYALFVWFSLNHILNEIPEGIPYRLDQLRKFADQYLETVAVAISRAYFIDETQSKTNMLVLSTDKFNNTVTVNANVYKEFLSGGGKNEALLGGLLSGDLAKTLGEVQSKSEDYVANYERNEALAAILRKNEAFTKFKEALIWGIGTLPYDGLSETEKSAWTEMNISVDSIVRKAKELVENLQSYEIDDVHCACLRVLVRARYPYTDAEKFLTSMAEVSKKNSAIDIREAGFLALIEKVGDYVADMIVTRQI